MIFLEIYFILAIVDMIITLTVKFRAIKQARKAKKEVRKAEELAKASADTGKEVKE